MRWTILIAGIVVGLLFLNGAFSAWWVSWGPPTKYPEASEHAALKRLGYSLSVLATGFMIFIALKTNFDFKKSVIKYLWLITVVVSLSYPFVREARESSLCIDSTGTWNSEYFKCEPKKPVK